MECNFYVLEDKVEYFCADSLNSILSHMVARGVDEPKTSNCFVDNAYNSNFLSYSSSVLLLTFWVCFYFSLLLVFHLFRFVAFLFKFNESVVVL